MDQYYFQLFTEEDSSSSPSIIANESWWIERSKLIFALVVVNSYPHLIHGFTSTQFHKLNLYIPFCDTDQTIIWKTEGLLYGPKFSLSFKHSFNIQWCNCEINSRSSWMIMLLRKILSHDFKWYQLCVFWDGKRNNIFENEI